MAAAEDVALYGLRISLGSILENFGFGTVSEDSVDLLSDIMRKFITNVASKSKFYAEHAGRTDAACKDIALAFRKIQFSTTELCDFASQNNFPPPKPFPKFPVAKANARPLYHPQPSEKELETRPEYIPAFLQAAHPEWTKEGADYLAVMKPSTSADKKGAAPDFPSFEGCSAKDMGLRKEDWKPPPPVITRTDDSSATGIRSSANIASQRLYNPDYAAQLSKKKNKPLSALKEGGSRSTTPVGRTNTPYEGGSEEKIRTDSPSTSKSSEKQKFKPRPPSSASRILFDPKANEPCTSAASAASVGTSEGAQSPMPKLEQEGQTAEESSLSVPPMEYEESFETPPRIDENLITANILLFQQLKQQQEREAKDKMEKDRQKEAKQKKKDEQKEKKEEAKRIKEELKREQDAAKKLAKEEEKKRKKEEKARLAAEAKAKAKEAKKLEAERAVEEALRAQTSTPLPSSFTTPSVFDEAEQKSLKLLITNPLSSNASSTFSPSPIRAPPSLREVTPAPSVLPPNEDEDTIPFYGESNVSGDTTFPLNISLTSTETPTPRKEKKKHKKKDKHRDRDGSPSSHHKKHKKDKEHKKHKKEKREREEKEREREHKHKHKEVKETKPEEPEQKPLTLKIRLGDQTPSSNDYPSSVTHEPVRLKFKFSSDKKDEEKVPPLRLGMPQASKDRPMSAEKVKLSKPEKTKSPYDREKEEKVKRREERKRREREEAEERQKAELERLKREHEQKQKKEAEEKKRSDDFMREQQREREERERKKEREKEQKLKMERDLALINATTDCIFTKKEKEKFKIDKYDTKEKEKKKEAPPPPPLPAPTVQDLVDDEEEERLWICPSCHVAWTEGANMVACDICNDWFHWHCVGLLVAPEDDIPWFCKKCSRKPLKRPSKSSNDSPKKKKKTEGFGYLK